MAQRLKRAESRELTRQRLLESAATLFAKRGFQATSVDDVAEAAGFSKGAFYYNFESKDELFQTLVEHEIGGLVSSLESTLAGAHTIESKLAAAQRLLTEREKDKSGAQLEFEVLTQAVRDPKLRKIVTGAYQQMCAAIGALIDEQFAQAGVRPPLPAKDLATAIVAGALGHGLLESLDPGAVRPGLLPSVVALLLRP